MPTAVCKNCGAINILAGSGGGRIKCTSCGNAFNVEATVGEPANEYYLVVDGQPSDQAAASRRQTRGCLAVVVLVLVAGFVVWAVNFGYLLVMDPSDRKFTELSYVESLAFSPDGISLAAGGSGRVLLWNCETGDLEGQKELKSVDIVRFSDEGKFLYAEVDSFNGASLLWNLQTGATNAEEDLAEFEANDRHDDRPDHDLSWARKGNSITVGRDYADEPLHILEGHTEYVYEAIISPDGKRLLSSAADNTIRLWNLETGMQMRQFESHGEERLIFLPAGDHFISVADRDFYYWSVEQSDPIFTGRQYDDITKFAVAPSRRLVATCEYAGAIRLWRLPE